MNDSSIASLQNAQSLDDLYPVLSANHLTAGWHKKRPSLWKEPRTEFQPLHWRYEVGRLALDQAGRWIDTELAERRNLLLFNPVGDNDYDTVRTLVAAYQMIKPGEHARAHRHTANALRFVLDAEPGVFSVVNGIKLPMVPGDVLLTPGECWHSHFNESDSNAYWIDVLDVPLVHLLEPMFFAEHPDKYQAVVEQPEDHAFWFPHVRAQADLENLPAVNGVRRLMLGTEKYFATTDLAFLKLDKGATSGVHRSTASRIFAIAQGSGVAHLGTIEAQWHKGDVLAVPSWTSYEIFADEDALIFEVNDEPTLRKLGFYKESCA